MYIIVEGMPASGKTTTAKALAQKYKAAYFKCLLPDDGFGNKLRTLRDSGKWEMEVSLFHIVDLFRNELEIKQRIAGGEHIIRDKCFISSLAHIFSVFPKRSDEIQQLLLDSYEELAKWMLIPDKFVFLDRSLEFSRKISLYKGDKSMIDSTILNDVNRFETQRHYLKVLAEKYFQDRMILVSGQDTREHDINKIVERIDSI